MKKLKLTTGFTLVEILIVITIVGLLATTSIGGYTRFRKSSMIDLAAKSIVASLYDARDNAKFGKMVAGASVEKDEVSEKSDDDENSADDERGASCFGLKFVGMGESSGSGSVSVSDADGEAGVFHVVSSFDSTKKWSGQKWIYEGCEDAVDSGSGGGPSILGTSVNLADGVKIESINNSDGSCVVLFAPPNGSIDGSQCVSGDASDDVKIVVGYGDEDEDLKRQININLKTGVAEIKKIEDEN